MGKGTYINGHKNKFGIPSIIQSLNLSMLHFISCLHMLYMYVCTYMWLFFMHIFVVIG